MSDKIDAEIVEELRTTNRLLAQLLIKDSSNQTERILTLSYCGFSPSNIADLLKIKDNVVRAILSQARKGEKGLKKG